MKHFIQVLMMVSLTLATVSASEKSEINVEGHCSSSAKKQSFEILTKKTAVKDCAKENAISLAMHECKAFYATGSMKDSKLEFMGCEKNEFRESGSKMIEFKCSYKLKMFCHQ